MQTAEEVIQSIYLLPKEEKGKLGHYIIQYGIMGTHLDLKRFKKRHLTSEPGES